MSDIAPLDETIPTIPLPDASDILDTFAKNIRLLEREGVTWAQYTLPINDRNARANLAAYYKAGCPSFALPAAEQPRVVEKPPSLIFIKETLLGTTRVVVYELGADLSFPQMFRASVRVGQTVPTSRLEQRLKERGLAFKRVQLDDMLEKQAKFFLGQEGGMDFGLRADWWNLILVEDEDGALSVVNAYWSDGRWYRDRHSLGHGNVWSRERRLVLSNSDASNL